MKQYSLVVVIAFLVFPLILACSGKPNRAVDEQENTEFVDPDQRVAESGGYEFVAHYKNLQKMIRQRAGADSLNPLKVASIKEQLKGMLYIDFRIRDKSHAGQSQDHDADSITGIDPQVYMSGLMQQDFMLLAKGDTFPCIMFHHEATGNASPYHTFILGFDTTGLMLGAEKTAVCMMYHDLLWGQGLQTFDFEIIK